MHHISALAKHRSARISLARRWKCSLQGKLVGFVLKSISVIPLAMRLAIDAREISAGSTSRCTQTLDVHKVISMTLTPSNPRHGVHVATIAHQGSIWDVYLDFEGHVHPTAHRASLRFEPPTGSEEQRSASTTVLIIEDSYEEAVAKARSFDDRQLQGLLRSALPDAESER